MAGHSADDRSDDHRHGTGDVERDVRETLGKRVHESDLPQELRHLDERERAQTLALRGLFARQEHALRERYARWIIRVLGAQMLVADTVFIACAWVGSRWMVDPTVIESWLVATVVQVVGIVLVVTRHLFPDRDGNSVET